MNCYDVREKLEPYLDLGLSDPEAQSLKKHLEHCPECQHEVETIRKIDEFVKMDLFEPPPREYWANVPAQVTERLGLRRQRPKLLGIFDSIGELLASPSVRWSGALAVAGLAIFVLLRGLDTQVVEPTSDPMASEHTADNSLLDQSSAPGASNQPAEPTEIVVTAPDSPTGGSATDPDALNRSVPPVVASARQQVPATSVDINIRPEREPSFDSKQAILARAIVEMVQPKDNIAGSPELVRALFPDAGSSFLIGLAPSAEVEEDEDKVTNARTFTMARGVRGSSSIVSQSLGVKETDLAYQSDDSDATDFFQTLLIVEDTKKLSERRNIWLSYVNRESNPTYRSLGIYRLADVCYRIADESRQEELAMKALSFYVKYENTLKSLMGIKAYDSKVAYIQGLLETN